MTTVRLNYDGWLALPAGMRQKLGITHRGPARARAGRRQHHGSPAPQRYRHWSGRPPSCRSLAVEPAAAGTPQPPPAAAAAPIVKRGPGRPRKTTLPVVPPTLKGRGGKRKAAPLRYRIGDRRTSGIRRFSWRRYFTAGRWKLTRETVVGLSTAAGIVPHVR